MTDEEAISRAQFDTLLRALAELANWIVRLL